MKTRKLMSRRTFLASSARLIGSLVTASVAGYGYSRWLEPHWVRVAERTLSFHRLPDSFIGKRIVQFSDIHLDFYFGLERMETLVNQIRRLKPDILVFTGDLYDSLIGTTGETCIELLNVMEAPLGKWAVLGNHDYTTGAANVERILAQGGFVTLINKWAAVEHQGSKIQIAGVDEVFHGNPDLRATLQHSDANLFTLLLAHEPDLADEALAFPIDLQLSGHSHGGQVRLPLIGHLFVPEMARKYPDGLYELGDGKLLLYTNRGIGMSFHPVRFMCRPEITVITLDKQQRLSPS